MEELLWLYKTIEHLEHVIHRMTLEERLRIKDHLADIKGLVCLNILKSEPLKCTLESLRETQKTTTDVLVQKST